MAHHNHGSDHDDMPGHILPKRIYVSVLIALIVLTVITVVVAQFDFGSLNLIVAMLVASVKAALVALFFMHLKYEDPFTWIYAIIPLFLLLLLIGGVFLDNPFRY